MRSKERRLRNIRRFKRLLLCKLLLRRKKKVRLLCERGEGLSIQLHGNRCWENASRHATRLLCCCRFGISSLLPANVSGSWTELAMLVDPKWWIQSDSLNTDWRQAIFLMWHGWAEQGAFCFLSIKTFPHALHHDDPVSTEFVWLETFNGIFFPCIMNVFRDRSLTHETKCRHYTSGVWWFMRNEATCNESEKLFWVHAQSQFIAHCVQESKTNRVLVTIDIDNVIL